MITIQITANLATHKHVINAINKLLEIIPEDNPAHENLINYKKAMNIELQEECFKNK